MDKLSRKDFLKRAGILGLGAMSGAALIQACGGADNIRTGKSDEYSSDPSPKQKPKKQPTKQLSQEELASADCSEYNKNLTEQDKTVREAVSYVEKSEDPEKNCANCRFWQPDKFDGPCGGCQLFASGAVNPLGNCKSWAAPI